MDNGKIDEKPRRKRPYVKPAVVVVALRPDEAVLGACKTSAASGPGSGGSCSPSRCRSQGS
jgi:hypothetical protein